MPHFYDREGNPHFDVRPKQAKEMGLFYSVTEIQKIEASPGLEMWKLNTAIETADASPRGTDESIDNYKKRIKNEMYSGSSATNLGTRIHDAIENCLGSSDHIKQIDDDLLPYVRPAITYFKEKGFVPISLEKIVTHPGEAYAGTADVIAKTSGGKDFILDWKSTKTIPSKPYATHPEQISAYAVAEFGYERVMNGEIWGANAYISTSVLDKSGDAKFRVHSYKPSVLAEAYKRFMLINELFRIRTGYDPREQN